MEKRLGIVTGSEIDDFQEIKNRRWKVVETPYGNQQAYTGYLEERPVAWIPRLGPEHELLPFMINPKAIMFALYDLGCRSIVGMTSVGIIDKAIPLAHPIMFDDLFFITNTLPDGHPCTFFTSEKGKSGHFVFEKPVSQALSKVVSDAAAACQVPLQKGGVLAQTLGPRLETAAEIRFLTSVGACAVTMASGYEMVLAGELEIPYVSIGFGINYATGVMPWASATAEMEENNADVAPVAKKLLSAIAANPGLNDIKFDTGFIIK